MKNPEDKDDIPSEIDFSEGVRGKYAARYREGVNLTERIPDPIGLYELQSRLGRALLGAQAFEGSYFTYLTLVKELSVQRAVMETRSALESLESSYFAELVVEWNEYATSSPAIEQRLGAFFRERNWLVHHSVWHVEPDSLEAQRAVAKRLEMLVDEAAFLSSGLDAVLARHLEARGMTVSEITGRRRQSLDLWAAA
jgi:hypothetical protein